MPFNENQFFYAALWWTAALPGGAEHVSSICDMHGLGKPDFSACPPPASDKLPVPMSKVGMFFSALYIGLGQTEGARIDLSAANEKNPLGFALSHTGLSKDLLPQQAYMSLMSDGRLFASTSDEKPVTLLRYAGMPMIRETKAPKPRVM